MNEINQILTQLNTFNDIYPLLKDKDNNVKGLTLEVLAKYYFKIHHHHKNNTQEIYLYDEIPPKIKKELNLPQKDKGIDLLIKYNDEWVAVQCKYRQDSNITVPWNDLATFFGLAFGINDKIKYGYFFTNTYNFCDEVINSEKVIPISGNTLHELDKIFFDNLKNFINCNQLIFTKHIPLPFQEQTINKARQYFKNNKRGHLEYICGAGKTKTSYWIARELVAERIIIFVPSLLLLSQFFDEWCYELIADKEYPNFLLIGSDYDNDLDNKYKDKLDGIKLTTNKEVIKQRLQDTDDEGLIVISTYQSADILIDACKEINYYFDLGIYDEAHKTVGQINKKFSMLVTNNDLKIHKILFMTATSKIYNGNLDDDEIVSMDNEELYGECIDSYNMYQAISDKRLCDYQILTMHTTNEYINEIINDNKLVNLKDNYNFDELQSLYVASAIIIFKCIEKYECTHMITYHNTVKRSKDFSKLLIELNKQIYKKDIYIDCIDGGTTMRNRRNTIREFEKNKLSIICSARVLNEGINIPIIDSECFVDPRSSTIDIIQCIGRAVRLHPNKKMAKIIVPILSDNIMDSEVDEGRYGNVIRILKSLSTTDEGIKEYFVLKSQNKSTPRNIINNEILQKENYTTNVNINEWNDKINAIIWSKTDTFMKIYMEVFQWVLDNKKLPSSESKNSTEKRLGIWCQRQRQLKKYKKLDQERIKKLQNIPKWFWNKEEKFNQTYNLLLEWISVNKKLPSIHSKNKIEKTLGYCCSYIRHNKKIGKLDAEIIKKLEIIPQWEWGSEEIKEIKSFDESYDELLQWVLENKRLPSAGSKNPIEKKLGIWSSCQRKNKKNGKLDQERIRKLEAVPLWNWGYKNKFYETYDVLIKWISDNNRLPSQISKDPTEKSLGHWCNNKRHNKKLGKLEDEIIKKLEAIPLWEWGSEEIKEVKSFDESYNELLQWTLENNKIPSKQSKNETERRLGMWCSRQRLNKKIGKLNEDQILKLEKINDWHW